MQSSSRSGKGSGKNSFTALAWLVWMGLLAASAAFHYHKYVGYGKTLNAVNGWAGLTFLAIALTALWAVSEILLAIFRVKPGMRTNIRIMLGTVLMIVAGTEGVLRLKGINATYGEQGLSAPYYTFYDSHKPSWFHTWPPDSDHELSAPGEFHYVRGTNSLGLSEREMPVGKDSTDFRVMALGDSFTEGVGAPYDSTWAKQLERLLAQAWPERRVQVINAGIAGSDPIYGYMLLREKLLAYSPDLVIQTVNFTDEGDIFIRGGMGRFQADGTVLNRQGPSWEPLYALSYIFRYYIRNLKGYEDILILPENRPGLEAQATRDIVGVLKEYGELSRDGGFGFLAVFHPMWNEVTDRKYEGHLGQLLDSLSAVPDPGFDYVDLLPWFAEEKGVNESNVFDFYWKEYHHNARGYGLFAEGVAQKILRGDGEE